MDERLEKFRDKIKLDNLTIALSCFILALFSFLAAMAEAGMIPFFNPTGGDSHWQSTWRGFISGAAFGIIIFMVVCLIRNIRALNDEKLLKKLYVKEHDERTIQIWTAARARTMQTSVILGLVAGIVAGYFNMVVCITLIAFVFLQSITGAAFALYYSYKT